MRVRQFAVLICMLCSLLPLTVSGQTNSEVETGEELPKETTFTFGGYAKLDWLTTQYFNGEPSSESAIRDIHLPGAIPIGSEIDGYDTELHARESRIFFEVKSNLAGSPVRMLVEMDFLLSLAGDERVSNSYNPRLRHFYFQWKRFLFGQTWTTFMTPEAIPEGIIFVGGADGLVFIRQAQARITFNRWSFGFENPETTYLPYRQSKFETSKGGFPDLITKYTIRKPWGILGFSGMVRTLRFGEENGTRNYTIGYGLNASGRIKTWNKDDFRFMVSTGEGLGRYLAFQFLTGAVLDERNELNTIGCVSGLFSYLHHWGEKFQSSVQYSFIWAQDQSQFTDGNSNQYAWSVSGGLMYNPHPKVLTGFQLLYATRQTESSATGRMFRLQFSAKYTFDFSFSVQHDASR